MTNEFIKKTQGFTLIETLVAVLILASAIAGPLTIASKGLSAANLARNQTAAQFLAQDGMEYVRFVRDSNNLCIAKGGCPTSDWLAGLDANPNPRSGATGAGCVSSDGSAKCIIDSLQDTAALCPSGVCLAFTYDGAAAPSMFTRSISIEPVGGSATEVRVTVTVVWFDNLNLQKGHQVVVIENMLNWQ